MKQSQHLSGRRVLWIRGGIITLTLLSTAGLVAILIFHPEDTIEALSIFVALLVMAGLADWLTHQWFALSQGLETLQERVANSEEHNIEEQKRLNVVLKVNSLLADASDETNLMQSILAVFSELTGAIGSSYVPLDNLGQPLAILNHGKIPELELKDWSREILSAQVQERCRACTMRKASHLMDCPLHEPRVFGESDLYCLPLARSDHMLGMVNLYLPTRAAYSDGLRRFLESLLNEIALAVDSIRLRGQETATLRHLQLVHTNRKDLPAQLKDLLENAQRALEADYALIQLPGKERQAAQVIFGQGESNLLNSPEVEALSQQAIALNSLIMITANESSALPRGVGALLTAPLAGPDFPPKGAIVIANASAQAFYPRQQKVLQTIASQAAVLVQNDKFITELEFRAMLEERNRLGREIHDGLAQTLAFLKLQAAQMQGLLNRKDFHRLKAAIDTNYRTLTDAYLDTRQAIDHLRVNPQDGLSTWLTQAVTSFTEASHIQVNLDLIAEPSSLPKEVQAQMARVAQEALSNVRKHARAHHVNLSLHRWQDDLILEIQDDGQGFSPEDVPAVSQYGLKGMRERAELIGADFQIISSPENGTIVRLRLPNRVEETPV